MADAGEWRALARSVGLPMVPYDSDHLDDVPYEADQTVLLIEGRVSIPGSGDGRPARPAGSG